MENPKENYVFNMLYPFRVKNRQTRLSVLLAKRSKVIKTALNLSSGNGHHPLLLVDHCNLREQDLKLLNHILENRPAKRIPWSILNLQSLRVCNFCLRYDVYIGYGILKKLAKLTYRFRDINYDTCGAFGDTKENYKAAFWSSKLYCYNISFVHDQHYILSVIAKQLTLGAVKRRGYYRPPDTRSAIAKFKCAKLQEAISNRLAEFESSLGGTSV